MTIQELIDKLNKIEDKSKSVKMVITGIGSFTPIVVIESDSEVHIKC